MLTAEQYAIDRAICDKARNVIETLWPNWRKSRRMVLENMRAMRLANPSAFRLPA